MWCASSLKTTKSSSSDKNSISPPLIKLLSNEANSFPPVVPGEIGNAFFKTCVGSSNGLSTSVSSSVPDRRCQLVIAIKPSPVTLL